MSGVRLLGRKFRVVQHFAAMVLTMALCGLWHGAGWNFIAWGTMHGLAMVFAAFWSRNLPPLPTWLGWIATFSFFLVSVVFFRAADLPSAVGYAGTLFGLGGIGSASVPEDGAGGILIVAGCLALLALHFLEAQLLSRRAVRGLLRLDGVFLRAVFAATAVWLLCLPKVQGNPFIYFRF
jgi:hypothetical protein